MKRILEDRSNSSVDISLLSFEPHMKIFVEKISSEYGFRSFVARRKSGIGSGVRDWDRGLGVRRGYRTKSFV